MITLALDLAGKTGYAIRYEDGSAKAGTWNLVRGELGGARSPVPMVRLWKRLVRLSQDHEIDWIIYEETFGRGAAKFRLDSLQYTALLFAMLNGIGWSRVSPTAWKKAVVGDARAKRDEYHHFARSRWPELNLFTDDQAAAMCLLAYGEQDGYRSG